MFTSYGAIEICILCSQPFLPPNTCGFGLGWSLSHVIPTSQDNGKPLSYNHTILNLKYFKEITFFSVYYR